jgi:signal transduction histidine kinase
MLAAATILKPRGLALLLGWRRILYTLVIATLLGLLNTLPSSTASSIVVGRAWLVGLSALLAYGVFEQWPTKLPRWLARWVLQLLAIVTVVPFAALVAYWLTTGEPRFWTNPLKLTGWGYLTITGVLFAPWIALTAMVRQREAFARSQALAFELERSELERQALDARMRLLRAQVQPHFLFNTLANVQALVDAGSPKAPKVLASLIAYLRAAVPRLDEPSTTLSQEVQLVRAYLELMHLRMPDRLQFSIEIDPAALDLRCPPLTLLTLVENAVRHGIDPSEEGGRIEITVRLHDGRCQLRVSDSGVGLRQTAAGPGTGLATLRERLQLNFGGDARLRLDELTPHGICAEVDIPAQRSAR